MEERESDLPHQNAKTKTFNIRPSMATSFSNFDASNCSNLIHELLQQQRQIETPFQREFETSNTHLQIDLNQSITEEEATQSLRDEFVPIFEDKNNHDNGGIENFGVNNIDNGEQAIHFAEEAIEIAENQVVQIDIPRKSIDSDLEQTTKSNATADLNPIDASGLDLRGSFVGVVRETFEEILEMYEKHAAILGFSIRKHTTRYITHTKIVSEKNYVCSAEGKRNSGEKKTKLVEMVDEENANVKTRKPRQVAITRSNCKACIRAKVNKEGQFEVVAHVIQHNHELTRSQWHYLHRSERKMTEEKVEAIKTMKSSGLTTMDTFNYMVTEAGGEQNVGHSLVDHLNFCSRLRME